MEKKWVKFLIVLAFLAAVALLPSLVPGVQVIPTPPEEIINYTPPPPLEP